MDAEWIQIIPQSNHRYFSITVYHLPTDFLHLRRQSENVEKFIGIFIVFWKCLKKCIWAVNLVGVCGCQWVLANSARDVKEMCDSSLSGTKGLVFSLSFPYNYSVENKSHGSKETHIRHRNSQFCYRQNYRAGIQGFH